MKSAIEEARDKAKLSLLGLTTAVYEGTDDERKAALSLLIADFNALCDAVEHPF